MQPGTDGEDSTADHQRNSAAEPPYRTDWLDRYGTKDAGADEEQPPGELTEPDDRYPRAELDGPTDPDQPTELNAHTGQAQPTDDLIQSDDRAELEPAGERNQPTELDWRGPNWSEQGWADHAEPGAPDRTGFGWADRTEPDWTDESEPSWPETTGDPIYRNDLFEGDEPTQALDDLDEHGRPGESDEPTGPGTPAEPAQPVRLDPPAPPDGPDVVREHLRTRRRGPLRRFTLYASGVDTRVLYYAPIEETEYIVQGTMVILTAIVAAISALAASSFLISGGFSLTPLTIAIGIAWGTMIFFFDRALVSGSFNPYHFTEEEVRSLTDRRVATPWSHLAMRRQTRRWREFVRVLAVGSVRIALALATSYIVADMVLFLVFQPEVNARAAFIQQELQAQRVASIQAEYAAQNAERAKQRDELAGASDPDIIRLTQQVDTLTKQLDAARKDLGVLQAAAAAEFDGDTYQAKLSDGTLVKTTGDRGNGAAARSLAQRRDTQQATVNDLQSRLNRARADLDARVAAIHKANASALTTLEALDNKATADQAAALAAATSDPQVINGLLLRKDALTNLEYDAKPETLVKDPVAPCTGVFAWFCHLRNAIIPPTPMGPTVAAYRMIFFFIEIMPITFKMINSLRRRRPYEVAKAALEEATHIDAFRLVDRHLHDASREVSGRAYDRRAWRESIVGEPEPLIEQREQTRDPVETDLPWRHAPRPMPNHRSVRRTRPHPARYPAGPDWESAPYPDPARESDHP